MSAVFWGGNPRKILDLWVEDYFELFASKEVLDEYQEIFDRLQKKYKTSNSSLWRLVLAHIRIISAKRLTKQVCEDPDDDIFLACAQAANAHYIVSGDKLLLKVKKFKTTEIVTIPSFLKIIRP